MGDPEDIFRAVWNDLGMKEAENYVKVVVDEANFAAQQAKKGDWSEGKAFLQRRRNLLLGILLPLALVLRFPGLVFGALRVLAGGALFALRDPRLQRIIGSILWKRFVRLTQKM